MVANEGAPASTMQDSALSVSNSKQRKSATRESPEQVAKALLAAFPMSIPSDYCSSDERVMPVDDVELVILEAEGKNYSIVRHWHGDVAKDDVVGLSDQSFGLRSGGAFKKKALTHYELRRDVLNQSWVNNGEGDDNSSVQPMSVHYGVRATSDLTPVVGLKRSLLTKSLFADVEKVSTSKTHTAL